MDCRNNVSPYCLLEHEDSKQLCLDLPLAHSEHINVVDAEAVEEQIADEAAMEEDNSQGGVADKARPDANEQAGEAVEQVVLVKKSEAVANAVKREKSSYFLLNLAGWPLCYGIFSCVSNFNSLCIL